MPLPRRLSKPGPVLDYLSNLSGSDPDLVEKTIIAIRECLSTPDGAILMDLLKVSTEQRILPPETDPRALEALNAQRFIVEDLRRITTDEYEQLRKQRQDLQAAARRRNARPRG